MNSPDTSKKLQQVIKSGKCSNKGCLSGGKDNLEIVWFGKQYEQKIITCSSCFVMNDQVIKKSVPTVTSVLPVSAFVNKFVVEGKAYEQLKTSSQFLPTDLKQRQKQHLCQLDNFQYKLTGTLKALSCSLQSFASKIVLQNQQIYNNETFNDLIKLFTNNQLDQSLSKIQLLINFLNYGSDEKYRFEELEVRNKKIEKLAGKIQEVTGKVIKVLEDMINQLQNKNSVLGKI